MRCFKDFITSKTLPTGSSRDPKNSAMGSRSSSCVFSIGRMQADNQNWPPPISAKKARYSSGSFVPFNCSSSCSSASGIGTGGRYSLFRFLGSTGVNPTYPPSSLLFLMKYCDTLLMIGVSISQGAWQSDVALKVRWKHSGQRGSFSLSPARRFQPSSEHRSVVSSAPSPLVWVRCEVWGNHYHALQHGARARLATVLLPRKAVAMTFAAARSQRVPFSYSRRASNCLRVGLPLARATTSSSFGSLRTQRLGGAPGCRSPSGRRRRVALCYQGVQARFGSVGAWLRSLTMGDSPQRHADCRAFNHCLFSRTSQASRTCGSGNILL